MDRDDNAQTLRQLIGQPNSGSLGEVIYNAIIEALMEGRLRAGDRLIMDNLAEELDVSRTPVREALQRLHGEAVVESVGRRGYVLREPSIGDTVDFYQARMAVEGQAAAHLASAEPGVLDSLRDLVDELGQQPPSSTYGWFDINRQFHRAVVIAAGNSYFVDMFDNIWNRSRTALTYRRFAVANPQLGFCRDHNDLIEAIAGADPRDARQSMIEHIRSGLHRTCRDAGESEATSNEQ